MNLRQIKTQKAYKDALKTLEDLMDKNPQDENSWETILLCNVAEMISEYEDKKYPSKKSYQEGAK